MIIIVDRPIKTYSVSVGVFSSVNTTFVLMYNNQLVWSNLTGNFYARYMHGNILNAKGLNAYHVNIRSLKNKVDEIKILTENLKPHILGCSECELRNEYKEEQLKSLKVPGYQILFPKSWDLHGYARVVVYIKNTLHYERISSLEDEHLQTVWVKSGFKNTKPGFFCNGYREHKSNLGVGMQYQYDKLSTFLGQWEEALNFGHPSEQNDVFVLCDMNLDSYENKWKDQSYHLYHLSQLVHRFCNLSNMDQLVNGVTRSQYNSVTKKTTVSCLDHIYTNVRFKCSAPTIMSFGDSDHELIGFTRLSKQPQDVTHTIRKRSYKFFDEEQFLADIAEIDWSDILTTIDLDEAVNLFTNKFKEVLNFHAPWILYQQRKHHKIWISKETKELMAERDKWKRKATALSIENRGLQSSQEEVEAWSEYKIIRNRVNNLKKNEESLKVSGEVKVQRC